MENSIKEPFRLIAISLEKTSLVRGFITVINDQWSDDENASASELSQPPAGYSEGLLLCTGKVLR